MKPLVVFLITYSLFQALPAVAEDASTTLFDLSINGSQHMYCAASIAMVNALFSDGDLNGGGGSSLHTMPTLFMVVAFIVSAIAYFVVYERRRLPSPPVASVALPIALMSLAIIALVFAGILLGIGHLMPEHDPTQSDRPHEEGPLGHHQFEAILCITAAIASIISLFLLASRRFLGSMWAILACCVSAFVCVVYMTFFS